MTADCLLRTDDCKLNHLDNERKTENNENYHIPSTKRIQADKTKQGNIAHYFCNAYYSIANISACHNLRD